MSKKYEISLWENYLVDISDQNIVVSYPSAISEIEASSGKLNKYVDERKIAVLGSDSMNAQFKALEPKFVQNVDGTNTLTFKMLYSYINTETGVKEENPFIKLLYNEAKIKLFWKNEWYDLVIKNIQKDSSGKAIIYTCTDLYINELSKNGFNLEFNSELENNQGTVQELGARILNGTEWSLEFDDTDSNQIIQQENEEATYSLTGDEILGFNAYNSKGEIISIDSTNTILLYYSVVQKNSSYLQFVYSSNNEFITEDNSMLVENGERLYVDNVTWGHGFEGENEYYICSKNNSVLLQFLVTKNVSNYRAKRLVRSQKQIYDPLIEKYVQVYELGADKTLIYKYTETVYNEPTIVNNLLINSNNFSSIKGWIAVNELHSILFKLYPEYNPDSIDWSPISYLRLNGLYRNEGLKSSIQYIPDGLKRGEQYIIRFKAMGDDSANELPNGVYISDPSLINFHLYDYSDENSENWVDNIEITNATIENDWIILSVNIVNSITRDQLLRENFGFFIDTGSFYTYWIEDIQFFPKIYGDTITINSDELISKPHIVYPGEIDAFSTVHTQYNYYYANSNIINKDELNYLYRGYTDLVNIDLYPVYNANFEKIRSISAKESNRYNLLKTLAETFECYIKFSISHDDNGRITLDENYVPIKKVKFVKEIGKQTGLGFVYGKDLKAINRTIDSNDIVTKTIVGINTNDYANDGFCSIARSKENYSKENYILNFNYYISCGLIDSNELNNDLYNPSLGIGYYYFLNQYNTAYDNLTEELTVHNIDRIKKESMKTLLYELLTALESERDELLSEMCAKAGLTDPAQLPIYIIEHPDNEEIKNLYIQYNNILREIANYNIQYSNLESALNKLKDIIIFKQNEQKSYINKINTLNLIFNKKYSRFIQEGAWTSQDYVDDDLYYLDAVNIAHMSAYPKITYNISVLRLEDIEEYKNKKFNLGDIAYIQDIDFFGYINIDGAITPKRQIVTINELISNLESPEKDEIVVQNYKNQFSSLLYNITKTFQQINLASGKLERASNSFTTKGEIDSKVLEKTFNNNNINLNINTAFYKLNNSGFISQDRTNPNKQLKLNNGRFYISDDGGTTWKSVISGDGISPQYLTDGFIDVNKNTVIDGNNPDFRWDSTGLNAYKNTDKKIKNQQFVRFDKFGIYGLNKESEEDYKPIEESEIWNDANFGLTWRGFFLKSSGTNGFTSISSDEDIKVSDGTNDRIKIGRLNKDGTKYGISINDSSGIPVIQTADDGSLWLARRLNISSSSVDPTLGSVTSGSSQIGIGLLEDDGKGHGKQIINIKNKFIVYEDGSFISTDADVKLNNLIIDSGSWD